MDDEIPPGMVKSKFETSLLDFSKIGKTSFHIALSTTKLQMVFILQKNRHFDDLGEIDRLQTEEPSDGL